MARVQPGRVIGKGGKTIPQLLVKETPKDPFFRNKVFSASSKAGTILSGSGSRSSIKTGDAIRMLPKISNRTLNRAAVSIQTNEFIRKGPKQAAVMREHQRRLGRQGRGAAQFSSKAGDVSGGFR